MEGREVGMLGIESIYLAGVHMYTVHVSCMYRKVAGDQGEEIFNLKKSKT